MSTKRIIFYNHFHNGDLHVSRGLVRQIINKVKQLDPDVEFTYSHKNSPDVLSDIPNLGFNQYSIFKIHEAHSNLNIINNETYINTWYGQQQYKYMNQYGLTMDCLSKALDDTCKTLWHFSLLDLIDNFSILFPIIDYTKYNTQPIKNWLSKHSQKKIFVSNGLALSDQATNFALTPIIAKLANKYTDKIFILTNVEKNQYTTLPNVVYSSNIINKNRFNLNENSFLSTHCDIIIGRNSGAQTFAMTQENLFQSNKKILLFTNIVPIETNKFWMHSLFKDKAHYSADIMCSNETNMNTIYNIINTKIREIK